MGLVSEAGIICGPMIRVRESSIRAMELVMCEVLEVSAG